MTHSSPPLVAPTDELAPEAMINEGGAIGQPHHGSNHSGHHRYSVGQATHDYPLSTLLSAFGAGLVVGWLIARD